MTDPPSLGLKRFNNKTLQTTARALQTTAETIFESDLPLSEDEKRRQKLFGTLVIVCFFTFLFSVIGYVSFVHFKRIRMAQRQRRELEKELENPEKPVINRRESVLGQGQKQVVIERRASVCRKQSSGSQNNSTPAAAPSSSSSQLFRQSSWTSAGGGNAPSPLNKNDIRQKGCHGEFFFPNAPSFPYTLNPYPIPTYLDNVLVRYREPGGYIPEEVGEEKSVAEETDDEDNGIKFTCQNLSNVKGKLQREDKKLQESGRDLHEEDVFPENEGELEGQKIITNNGSKSHSNNKHGNKSGRGNSSSSYDGNTSIHILHQTSETTLLLNT